MPKISIKVKPHFWYYLFFYFSLVGIQHIYILLLSLYTCITVFFVTGGICFFCTVFKLQNNIHSIRRKQCISNTYCPMYNKIQYMCKFQKMRNTTFDHEFCSAWDNIVDCLLKTVWFSDSSNFLAYFDVPQKDRQVALILHCCQGCVYSPWWSVKFW